MPVAFPHANSMNRIMHKSAPSLPQGHPSVRTGKTGVLLVNLGTPDSTNWWDIRRYLKEFLSDQRVIEVNPLLWQVILNLFILTFRPSKAAHAYKLIWREESNESPLRYYTRLQAEKLAHRYTNDESLIIDWAMRYGNPSIDSRMKQLREQGCNQILVVPLYPQYAAATSATVCDESFRSLMKMRWQPAIRTVQHYPDHPAYIRALANSVHDHLSTLDWKPDVILTSFHGIPKDYFDKGDPYHCYCHKTARLLREKLNMTDKNMRLTFQSRFGPREWLQPYTDKVLEALPSEGVKKVAIIAPGFASDCVETLEELAIQGKDTFANAGGTHFTLIPCLNERDDHIDMLQTIVDENIAGWLPQRNTTKSEAAA